MVHHGEHAKVVEAFVAALQHLPAEHAPHHYEYAYRMASQAARHLMEALLESTVWPVYSPFAKMHYGKGLQAGRAEGEARAVLTILEARGIPVSEDDRAFIMECTDLERLDEWARRAVTATSSADLFAEES